MLVELRCRPHGGRATLESVSTAANVLAMWELPLSLSSDWNYINKGCKFFRDPR